MRMSVEFESFGRTMSEMIENATTQWKEFVENDDATLPNDAEIHVESHTNDEYKGVVFARIKVEIDG